MTYDVTKVTYNMYSCDTCCMSREMIEMDDLDSAKWQTFREKDINVILLLLNDNRTKYQIVVISFLMK